MVTIPNVLANRYASPEMVAIFDPVGRVIAERRFWVAVLAAQIELGLEVDSTALSAYEAVVEQVDLDSIRQREQVTRHDVKARLEEFSALAGLEVIHQGMTSRDLTENVEALQQWNALELVEQRGWALADRLADRAEQYRDLVVVARTHNVAAQPTTLGRRFAMIGEELVAGLDALADLRARFAIRGIKGPVGTQQDQIDLLGGPDAAGELDQRVAEHLGIPRILTAPGQVAPRSRELEIVATLVRLAAPLANLALTVRLLAGQGAATEGFAAGQVGSSAMPHKMNARSSERIGGLAVILRGHLSMASELAGNQWFEGDVSCSVVRRVLFPDSFLAIDGAFETAFSVLEGFGAFDAVLGDEVAQMLPFLATPTLLAHATRSGLGREVGHELIKEHAVAEALRRREDPAAASGLLEALAADDRFPGDLAELSALLADASALAGAASAQTDQFVALVRERSAGIPDYAGGDVL